MVCFLLPMISTPRAASLASGSRPWPLSARVMAALAVLFLGRVIAQLTQAVGTVPYLPSFDDWQSGALPYPILLISQVAILIAQTVLVMRVAAGTFVLSTIAKRLLLALGWLYLTAMAFRLVAGLTFLDGDGWFDARLPSIFHLVLASFVLVTGHFGVTGRTVGS